MLILYYIYISTACTDLFIVTKLHYILVLGSRMSSTSGPDRSSLQLATIHEIENL